MLMSTEAAARLAFKNAQSVCFDVDSTVCTYEGIDILADFKGVGAEVAELTRSAMAGSALFEDTFRDRLNLIKPSAQDFDRCLSCHPVQLSPGVAQLVQRLHERGTIVHLVSGGMTQMVLPVAERLQIPSHRVFANTILFNADGSYKTFDERAPTSRDGGKKAVIQTLIDQHGYSGVVMVGDGATDMQARPPASAFIGYGGIVVRDKVRDGADWFITDFQVGACI